MFPGVKGSKGEMGPRGHQGLLGFPGFKGDRGESFFDTIIKSCLYLFFFCKPLLCGKVSGMYGLEVIVFNVVLLPKTCICFVL